jgi:hypothetical protein
LSEKQAKWVSRVQGFDIEIQYKKGVDNMVADSLSHLPELTSVERIDIG